MGQVFPIKGEAGMTVHPDNDWTELLPVLAEVKQRLPSTRDLRNWMLVLAARGIPFRVDHEKRPTTIEIPRQHLEIARHEISLYRAENDGITTPETIALQMADNALPTLSVLLLLGIFHNLTYFHISGFGHGSIDWLQLGNADSGKILAGEWWRIVTALTLHADGLHLLGNLLIGGYFVVRLCQIAGSGLGWSLVLASGALGNLLNALMHGSGHNAVGASTAIFGAIGIAGALNAVLARQRSPRFWLLPMAAAAVLLVFLGTGEEGSRTDIGAHLFGFFVGIGLGIPAGLLLVRSGQPKRAVNILLIGAGIAVVLGSWLLALIKG